jgi:hypothetical protein
MKCVAMSIKGCVFPGEILKTHLPLNLHWEMPVLQMQQYQCYPANRNIIYICKEKVKNKMLLKL